MHGFLRPTAAIVFGALLLVTPTAPGGENPSRLPPVGIADRQIGGGPADQTDPAIAWNATDNEYLVVWTDARNVGTRGHDIYGRRVDSAGSPVGPEFCISGPQALTDEYEPTVAWNQTADRYLVVWRDGRDLLAKGAELFGRVLQADGTPLGGDHRISSPKAISGEFEPAVVWNETAEHFLVVWVDTRDWGARGWDIYARLVGPEGIPAGGDRRVSAPGATSDEKSPAVAWDQSSNQYLVAWEDERNAGTTGEDIYGRLLDSDGTPIGGDRRISGPKAIFDEHEPDLAWNQSASGYLAVWQDERNDGTTGDDIYGRLLAADGSPAGGDHRLSGAAAAGNEYRPAVSCHGGTLRCLVVWHDSRNDMVRGFDIYGRYVGADGKASGYEVLVSGTAATGDEAIAALAGNQTSNRYQVIWQDYRNSGLPHFHGWDIYGRRVAG